MQRYFVDEELTEQLSISDKELVHHVVNVMKNHPGEVIALVNDGRVCEYEIINTSREMVDLQLVREQVESSELNVNVDMAIGFLKKDNFELSIQKLTELGVHTIIPTKYMRNVVKIDQKKWPKKKTRYQEIIKSAAKQSRRNIIPEISDMKTLKEIDYSKYDQIIVCYELEQENHLTKFKNEIKNSQNVLVIIGPEGGIDQSEIDFLTSQENCKVITLGKRILRAETAIITTMSNVAMIIEGDIC